jgi:hypothetical protein
MSVQPMADTREGIVPALAELIALREQVRAWPPARRTVTGVVGPATAVLRGRGMEYAESRPYSAGDEVRHIEVEAALRDAVQQASVDAVGVGDQCPLAPSSDRRNVPQDEHRHHRPTSGGLVVVLDVRRIPLHLVEVRLIETRCGLELQHDHRASGEDDHIGPSSAFHRQFVFEHHAPARRWRVLVHADTQRRGHRLVFLRPHVNLRA